MRKKLTTEQFIEKAIKIHGNTYDYRFVQYVDNKTRVKIICSTHGPFFQSPNSHISKRAGCPMCYKQSKSTIYVNNTDDFIKRSTLVHGDRYDYTKVKYVNCYTKVTIICNKHGQFEQTPVAHYNGQNCPKCRMYTASQFIENANRVHHDTYKYDNIRYNGTINKVTITCKKHGPFTQFANRHIQGAGCPVCRNSHGERLIAQYLQDNHITYITEYKFNNCRNKNPLPFDFYLPDHNICIEFDGKQHFHPNVGWHQTRNDLIETEKRDKIKTDYCNANNITLIRIKYTDIDNIKHILDNAI